MKYLNRYNENRISIFDGAWEKFLPNKLKIVTNNGNFELSLNKENSNLGHRTDVTNISNFIQISYYQQTFDKPEDVNKDGEPDYLCFDITMVKNNDGHESNPDTLKLNIDVTYGDSMMYQFTIEKPNKVHVAHYNGYGSKYDPESFFGFEDDSLKELVNFFNRFGYKLSVKDFTFIDKYPDSYIHTESIKLMPDFNGKSILVINNSKPQENRYLKNIIKYLDDRGINKIIVSSPEEFEKNKDEDIIGAISTGSEYRINKPENESNDVYKISEKALESLKCPVLGLGYGMQSLVKFHGSEFNSDEELKLDNLLLDEYDKSHPLFKGVELDDTKLSFSFHDCPKDTPEGFNAIAKIGDKIVGVSNKKLNRFGFLFHPEDIESTIPILDNFIILCKGGKDEVEDMKSGDMKYLQKYESFIKNRMNESKSNYDIDLISDGFHEGTIKGYEVHLNDIDISFKCTTGLKNMFQIPCHVYINDGEGIVFYKGGALFTDEETQSKWRSEFNKLDNDPRFIKAKNELK